MVRQHQTSDAQLRIGESRDSGFDASHRPGMTVSDASLAMTLYFIHYLVAAMRNSNVR